jgi:hypothetical protein
MPEATTHGSKKVFFWIDGKRRTLIVGASIASRKKAWEGRWAGSERQELGEACADNQLHS